MGTRVPRYNPRVTCPDTRYRYGGSAMFYRLNPKGGKLPGKMVVLTHDIAHRSVVGIPVRNLSTISI